MVVQRDAGDRARRAHGAASWPGLTIDDIDIVDLYSCFPSAVQLGAQSLGLDLERQLTRTGGLPFAGGPWNNYVMHAIATMMNDLRDRPGEHGLVWANGGYTTKHAFGVYSTTPPADGFQHAYPQDEIDAMPRRELAEPADAAGRATIEAYTVMHSRDGEPETAIAACLLADGRRAWGTSTEMRRRRGDVRRRMGRTPCVAGRRGLAALLTSCPVSAKMVHGDHRKGGRGGPAWRIHEAVVVRPRCTPGGVRSPHACCGDA